MLDMCCGAHFFLCACSGHVVVCSSTAGCTLLRSWQNVQTGVLPPACARADDIKKCVCFKTRDKPFYWLGMPNMLDIMLGNMPCQTPLKIPKIGLKTCLTCVVENIFFVCVCSSTVGCTLSRSWQNVQTTCARADDTKKCVCFKTRDKPFYWLGMPNMLDIMLGNMPC